MPLPIDARRLRALDFTNWRKAVEGYLQDLDNRIATRATSDAGQVVVWPVAAVPSGWLATDGTVVSIAEHPSLYGIIGTTFNTGGEGAGAFRLPNWPAPVPGGVWIIRG